MISILIPVYNCDALLLVRELSSQAAALSSPCEIIVADDHSSEEYRSRNRDIAHLPHVRYTELDRNLGRLHVRLHLASLARFEWLLFIDSDSRIIRDDFLAAYVRALDESSQVIVGGRVYEDEQPRDCRHRLHWEYGRRREDVFTGKTAFHTNNFCIRKPLFQSLSFNAPWQGYGHEDTWIGIQLEQKKAAVSMIRNPVLHEGLEDAGVFLQKSHEAVKNLPVLAKICGDEAVERHVKLYRAYRRLLRWNLRPAFISAYKIWKPRIEKNLHSCKPSLRYFDLHRLYVLMTHR
jgi:glycosyltransferase involved in cell wall biosynthesis